MGMTSTFTLNIRLSDVAVVTIDMPGEEMNTLEVGFAPQVWITLEHIRDNKALCGVMFTSAKSDNFIAEADIDVIGSCHSAQGAETLTRQGQQTMAETNALSIPIIAAIHGTHLSDSLEMALACHNHVCTDDVKTVLDLSEAQLGLLPGSDGTQRLSRLIGVNTALDMILTGK